MLHGAWSPAYEIYRGAPQRASTSNPGVVVEAHRRWAGQSGTAGARPSHWLHLEAARRMGMSYMRAWTLLRTMNRCFKEPLVSTVRGGSKGGGSKLTRTGKRVLALYRQAERQSFRATQAAWRRLLKLMRD